MTYTTQPPADPNTEFQRLLQEGRAVFAAWKSQTTADGVMRSEPPLDEDDDIDDLTAPLVQQQQEADEDDHERNFRLMGILRKIAQKFNNQAAINEIAKAARAKRRWDLLGKIWAVIYGLASGACIAGFVVLTAGMGHFKAQPLYALALAVPLWCSARANWWLVRRDPADMLFHWWYAPKSQEHISRSKRFFAMFTAFLDAILIAGLTTYGAWTFMGAVGLSPLVGAIIAGLFFAATFIPELSLNFNNNKKLLERGRVQFTEFKNTITEDGNPAYLRKFWVYFACAFIGMAFSAFATLPVAAQFGVPTLVSLPVLVLVTLFGIGFYFNKAKEQVLREFNADKAAAKAATTGQAVTPDPEHEKRFTTEFVINRWVNAIGHALISFLGVFEVANYFGWIHMGERSFTMSHLIGVMQPTAPVILVTIAAVAIFVMGTVASYIGNASGIQEGYEKPIDKLVPAWQSTTPDLDIIKEPKATFASKPVSALSLLSRQDFVSTQHSQKSFETMAYEAAGIRLSQ